MRPFDRYVGAKLLFGIVLLCTGLSVSASDSLLDREFEADIPAQALSQSLLALSRQSKTQILVPAEPLQDRLAPPVQGRLTLRQALDLLLDGVGLSYRTAGAATVSIHSGNDDESMSLDALLSSANSSPSAAGQVESAALDDLIDDYQSPDPSPLTEGPDAIPVAGDAAQGPSERTPIPGPGRLVEEILVTANRREQNLQEFAGGIQVFDGQALEKSGASGFEDYVFQIPGADLVDTGSVKKVSLRGIGNLSAPDFGAGGTTSPVGIYLNDTPIQGNGNLPDLGLYDLERIEVLKGPQGTLYGEGAQGGAFKMLLKHADPGEFYGKGEVGIGQTHNGSGMDNFQKAAVNVPLRNSWAVRLVGTRRVDQGYVDFFNRDTQGEDDAANTMGRVHLDGELMDALSVSAFVIHQRQRLEQFPTVQLEEGELRNRNAEPQFANTDFTLGSLTLDYDLGFAELTSASSGFLNDRAALVRSPFVGVIADFYFQQIPGGAGAPAGAEMEWLETDNHQFGFAQELRLVSSSASWLDWVAGGFYRKRKNDGAYLITNSDTDDTEPPVGPGITAQDVTESFEQFALFGELYFDLPWDLELILGLRAFQEEVRLTGAQIYRGPFYPVAVAAGHPDGTLPPVDLGLTTAAITPKLSMQWYRNESQMFYALVANGVRSGGTNTNSLSSNIPPVFEPDSLWTYEAGAKTSWFGGLLVANLAAFYNDWKDLQVPTVVQGTFGPVPAENFNVPVILNAGRAYSKGLELELSVLPFEDVTLGFNLFLGDGEIVEGDPTQALPDHTPLPQLADVSFSGFAGYTAHRWPIFGLTPSLQIQVQSTGDRTAAPPVNGVPLALDGFRTYSATLGFSSDKWELSVAVANLTDERYYIGAPGVEPTTLTAGRPRNWLARLAYHF